MPRSGANILTRNEILLRTVPAAEAAAELGDVQANLLRPHGRRHSAFLFLDFEADRAEMVGRWIADIAERWITRLPESLGPTAGDGPFAMFMLSAEGYRRLGLEPPVDRCFRKGMKKAALNDPPPTEWESGLAGSVSALLLLADDDAERLESRIAGFEPPRAVVLASIEYGTELPGGIEHFGFVDGISQPLFLDEDIAAARARADGCLLWDPATPLRSVLAPDPYGAGENSFGSYAVFRKLRQDVAGFEAGVAALAKATATDDATAGAMVVGRFKDGTPLSLAREPGLGPINNFTYLSDRAGRACPYPSHIRRVNPRGQMDYVAHTPDIENRITRRAVPYGRPGEVDVGLLFLCFQSDIAAQFELIQNNWCNFPHFPIVRAGRDPLVGQRNSWDHGSGQQWPVPEPKGGVVTFDFPTCVTMRGGEYFFAPSISFLRGLGG